MACQWYVLYLVLQLVGPTVHFNLILGIIDKGLPCSPLTHEMSENSHRDSVWLGFLSSLTRLSSVDPNQEGLSTVTEGPTQNLSWPCSAALGRGVK